MRPALTKQDKLLQKTSSGIKQIKTYAFLDRSSNTKLLSKEIGPYLEVNGEIENLNINIKLYIFKLVYSCLPKRRWGWNKRRGVCWKIENLIAWVGWRKFYLIR